MTDPAILIAIAIYLYAGWTQAELAYPGFSTVNKTARGIAYCGFLFGWILFMPWYPKLLAKRRKTGRIQ